MIENLNHVSNLAAGLWITGIVCFISVLFPSLLYWVLLLKTPFEQATTESEIALSAAEGT